MPPPPPSRDGTGAPLFPREHGAWSMLGQPYVAALILARQWNWLVLPATAAVLAVFLLREPLVTLARQRWVWREAHPETPIAWKRAVAWAVLWALSGTLLAAAWPWQATAALGVAALAMTLAAVWFTVRNRHRAIWFQIVSAAGLGASALVACLSLKGEIPTWAWWLWLAYTAHSAAAVLTVRARLEVKIAARSQRGTGLLARAAVAQAMMLAVAMGCIAGGRPWLALPLALSAFFHLFELWGLLANPSAETPLRTVGRRALLISAAFSALTIAALW